MLTVLGIEVIGNCGGKSDVVVQPSLLYGKVSAYYSVISILLLWHPGLTASHTTIHVIIIRSVFDRISTVLIKNNIPVHVHVCIFHQVVTNHMRSDHRLLELPNPSALHGCSCVCVCMHA